MQASVAYRPCTNPAGIMIITRPLYRQAVPVLAALIACVLLISGCSKTERDKTLMAPQFTIATLDGGVFSLDGAAGHPVVINFWASWCGPCRFEAPTLQKAYLAYAGSGVKFIGVAIQDSEEGARNFIGEYGIAFPNGLDTTGELMRAYSVTAVPKTIIVDKEGVVTFVHSGMITEDVLVEQIKNVL